MTFQARVEVHLRELVSYPDRHVGGEGNRAATAMFAREAERAGFAVRRTSFECLEWEYGDAVLSREGAPLAMPVHVGPYSPACEATAPLVAASSVEQIEAEEVRGSVLLLHGDIAAGQIMPKHFTFYNPEGHKRIVSALEKFAPAAVIAATGSDPQMVGSQYPFPLFEDGDLDVPNAYMKDVDGERLLGLAGTEITLSIDSRRIPATAEHVVATLPGTTSGRIVLTAHIDSRKDSPGALDNASGVAVLLGVAELLGGKSLGPTVELVPFNGEDNYANPGEMLWVAENEGRFGEIVVGINIDDLGMSGSMNHVSFYACPPDMESTVREIMSRHPGTAEGPPWFQSDHAIFGIYGRPAIALASSEMTRFMAEYAHSQRDTFELVDTALLAEAARFIDDSIRGLSTVRFG
jgi:aminopeptidase YwaD